MKHRMKFVATLIAILLVGGLAQACSDAQARTIGRVTLGIRRQAGDSILLLVDWETPPAGGPRRAPIAGYEVRVVDALTLDTIIASSIGLQLADTLTIAYPALGDSLLIYAAVASRDIDDDLSVWSISVPLSLPNIKLPPLPPGNVGVDTLAVPFVIGVIVAPSTARVKVGEQQRFCGFVEMSDGTILIAENSAPYPECRDRLDALRTLRSA